MSAVINSETLDSLRGSVKGLLTEFRYLHTLGVERAALRLGRIFMPDKEYELRACALLHDITKELSYKDQLELIERGNIRVSSEDLATENALHSFSAVEYIKREYPQLATADILEGVFNHTLGAPDMSLFSTIIFISDYIEDGRLHDSCKRVSDFLYDALSASKGYNEKLKALYSACVMSIDYTIASLDKRGISVNSRTIMTKNAFQALI